MEKVNQEISGCSNAKVVRLEDWICSICGAPAEYNKYGKILCQQHWEEPMEAVKEDSMMKKITLIASSVRTWLWDECLSSLKDQNNIDFEVVFAGPLTKYQVRPYLKKYPFLRYIHTGLIKPAQCYQIAFLESLSELVMWIADDCEFDVGLLRVVYDYYQTLNNPKAIVSVWSNENNKDLGTDIHTCIGWNVNTQLMAPLGVISQKFLADLGGFDKRFISGQYENDVVMRAVAVGGEVYTFNVLKVHIDHILKHGDSTKFWSSYQHDRKILEDTWVLGGYKRSTPFVKVTLDDGREIDMFKILDNRKVLKAPQLPFEPYEDRDDILTVNQGPAGIWEAKEEK